MLDARIVDQDVGTAERRLGGLDQPGDLIGPAQVGAVEAHAYPEIRGDAAAHRLYLALIA